MASPRVILSSQLQDQEHGRPVVQGLKDLAKATNDHDAALQQLIARVGAIKVPSITAIKDALQATGPQPLNPPVSPGGGTSSGGTIIYGTHGDRLALVSSAVTTGTLFIETDRFALYEWSATGWTFLGNVLGPLLVTALGPDTRPADLGAGDNGFIVQATDANGAWWKWSGSAWVFQIGTGVPIEVTLNPSTKPILTVHDVGFGIWATDYHRFYLWTGAAWAEGEHNDARFQIAWFAAVPDQQGWFKCDGSVVQQSTTTATHSNYGTPDLISLNQFIRSAAAAGGTGGNPTHHHSVDPPSTVSTGPTPNTSGGPTPNTSGAPTPNSTGVPAPPGIRTGTPDNTTLVDNTGAGSTIAVATDNHTHDMNGHTHDLQAHTHDLAAHTHDLAAHTHATDIAAFDSGDTTVLPPYYEAVPYIRL